MIEGYHSGIYKEYDGLQSLDYYSAKGDIVFRYDIISGTSPRFKKADCVYTEPAYRPSFEEFIRRAGKHFICSDINGKCIYYIAKTYMGYDNENISK